MLPGPSASPSAGGRNTLCLCSIFFKSKCDKQTCLSLEKTATAALTGGIRRHRASPACQLIRSAQGGRSRSQAQCRGLTLSTSWSLWLDQGHLCDTEPEQPTLVAPPRFFCRSRTSGPRFCPQCGREPGFPLSSHLTPQKKDQGQCWTPAGHILWALPGSCLLLASPVRQPAHTQRSV